MVVGKTGKMEFHSFCWFLAAGKGMVLCSLVLRCMQAALLDNTVSNHMILSGSHLDFCIRADVMPIVRVPHDLPWHRQPVNQPGTGTWLFLDWLNYSFLLSFIVRVWLL